METMKLALTAMGICALLGASTNAHAKFGATTTQPSYRSQATQRSSSATTRLSSAVKSAPSKANAGAIKTTLAGAKTKLASLTKGVRLGPSGSVQGAKSRVASLATIVLGGVTMAGGVGLAGAASLYGMDPTAGVLGAMTGAFTMIAGGVLAHEGY